MAIAELFAFYANTMKSFIIFPLHEIWNYVSLSYFNNIFKQHAGTLLDPFKPSIWRDQI